MACLLLNEIVKFSQFSSLSPSQINQQFTKIIIWWKKYHFESDMPSHGWRVAYTHIWWSSLKIKYYRLNHWQKELFLLDHLVSDEVDDVVVEEDQGLLLQDVLLLLHHGSEGRLVQGIQSDTGVGYEDASSNQTKPC